MNIGFAVNAAAVESVTTSYVKVTMSSSAVDVRGAVLPQAGFLSNLELKVLGTAGSPTTITAYLTWDTTGDHPCTAAATITLVPGATANVFGGATAIDKWFRSPTARAAGPIYLWCKTDAGTVTVQEARIHWCDSLGR